MVNTMELNTKRLTLRPWKESDAETLYMYAKDPRVGPKAGWAPHKSVEESLSIIKHLLQGKECYAICLRDAETPIGAIELMLHEKSDVAASKDACELGYWLAYPFWGKGYMPEAAEELLRHGFEDLDMKQIWCGYYEGNMNSKRVQEKCGFSYYCTIKDVEVAALHEKRTRHTTLLKEEDWKRLHSKV